MLRKSNYILEILGIDDYVSDAKLVANRDISYDLNKEKLDEKKPEVERLISYILPVDCEKEYDQLKKIKNIEFSDEEIMPLLRMAKMLDLISCRKSNQGTVLFKNKGLQKEDKYPFEFIDLEDEDEFEIIDLDKKFENYKPKEKLHTSVIQDQIRDLFVQVSKDDVSDCIGINSVIDLDKLEKKQDEVESLLSNILKPGEEKTFTELRQRENETMLIQSVNYLLAMGTGLSLIKENKNTNNETVYYLNKVKDIDQNQNRK